MTDEELIRRFKQGDEKAVKEMLKRYTNAGFIICAIGWCEIMRMRLTLLRMYLSGSIRVLRDSDLNQVYGPGCIESLLTAVSASLSLKRAYPFRIISPILLCLRRVFYIPILAAASLLILISGLLLWRGYIHREPQFISEPLFPSDTLSELMIVAKNREEIEELILQEMAPKTFNLLEEEIENIEELIDGLSDTEKLLLCEELKKIKGGGE